MDNDFPIYSEDAKLAKDLFVKDSVAAIFYFEDHNHESIYERLLSRLIPDLKEFEVICLGGKTEIWKKARSVSDSAKDNLPHYIFIVDKDFDDLLDGIVEIANVYYLRRYCLENYIIAIDPLIEIAIERSDALTKRRARQLINDFSAFYDRFFESYRMITRLFVVARRFRVRNIETTKMSVGKLLKGADPSWPIPTNEWISEYRRQLQLHCHGDNEWLADDAALDVQLSDAFVPKKDPPPYVESNDDHLCGKHIFGCIILYIESRLGVTISDLGSKELYMRILSFLDLQPLRYLSEQISCNHKEILRHMGAAKRPAPRGRS